MTYRRKRQAFRFFVPFGIYGEMGKLGMQTSEMLVSSAVVIFYRSHMISQAMSGRLSWGNPEFASLWQEKMLAGMQAYSSLKSSLVRQSLSPLSLENGLKNGIKTLTRSTRPYHRKAKANAIRLSKKAIYKKRHS